MALLTLSLLFALHSYHSAFAAPVQNLTALQTEVSPSWVADPSGRGTWSLLYSCIFTLVLCVWTSIHLNVPPSDDSAARSWARKVKWLVIALFAPEIVVFAAFQQWLTAWTFLKDLRKIEGTVPAAEKSVSYALSKWLYILIHHVARENWIEKAM